MGQNNVVLYGALITVASLSLGYWAGTKAASPIETSSGSVQIPPASSSRLPINSQEESDTDGDESDSSGFQQYRRRRHRVAQGRRDRQM
ncbi:hypothetical protein BJ912DRAFT_943428 [Pholiota molesta]|nr:hypothetical protein BJ912DRAFT_943428 [Pholiota molesta]